jgi:hypothetical protein
MKPYYIKKMENKWNEVYSHLIFPNANNEFIKFTDSRFELVHSTSSIGLDLKIIYSDKIYLTKQGFYVYLSITDEDDVKVNVFYIQDKLPELQLVFGQILKQKNLWKLQQKN